MPKHKAITDSLALIFQGIDQLKNTFPERAFTIDGRLVGDIGEVIAALEYDLAIDTTSQPNYDGVTSSGQKVQIKATFKNSLTFKTVPDYYLGFKLYPNGEYEEIFNGPGQLIYERYNHRKNIGVSLLSFPIEELRKISTSIPITERIPRRENIKLPYEM